MQRSTRAYGLLAYEWYPMSISHFSMIFSVDVNFAKYTSIPPECSNALAH
jgi:hypothetical protein